MSFSCVCRCEICVGMNISFNAVGTRVSFGGRSQETWQLAENLAQQERLGTRISHASPHLRSVVILGAVLVI